MFKDAIVLFISLFKQEREGFSYLSHVEKRIQENIESNKKQKNY